MSRIINLLLFLYIFNLHANSIRKVDVESISNRQKVCSRQDYSLASNFFVTVLGNEITNSILDYCINTNQNPSIDSKRKIHDLNLYLRTWKKELIEKVQLPNPLIIDSIVNKSKLSNEIRNTIRNYLLFRIQKSNGLKLETQPYEFSVYIIYLRNMYIQDEFKQLLFSIHDPLLSTQELNVKLREFSSKLNSLEEAYQRQFLTANYLPIEVKGIVPNKKWFSTVAKQIIANPYLKATYKSKITKLNTCLEAKSNSELNNYAGFFQDYDIPFDFSKSKDKSFNSYLKLFVNNYFDERIFGERLNFLTEQCFGN